MAHCRSLYYLFLPLCERNLANVNLMIMKQVAGPLGSEESLRIDTSLQQTSSMNSFSEMGNNALAGALAGMFVSLWLHPIDTVKTIIQSRTVGHRLLFHNLGSIMSERDIAGLYRGIGSNPASSAPISGIYTFM